MFSIGVGEAAIVLIIVALTMGLPLLVGLLLHVWASRVAKRRATVLYRRLGRLPLAGMVLLVASWATGIAWTASMFAAASHAAPDQKARILAEAISEGMNGSVVLGVASGACFLASALASLLGSREPPGPPAEPRQP